MACAHRLYFSFQKQVPQVVCVMLDPASAELHSFLDAESGKTGVQGPVFTRGGCW